MQTNTTISKILILDFGSQYTELITKRIRSLGVYSEVKNFDLDYAEIQSEIKSGLIKGIILSGGPNSIYDEEALWCDERFLDPSIPVLGICYGMQLISQKLGGKVEKSSHREYGKSELSIKSKTGIFEGLTEETINCWMSHGDHATQMPPGFELIGQTSNCPIAAMQNLEKNIYAIQFHPEVNHTEKGLEIIKNFVIEICKCSTGWSMHNFIDFEIEQIKKEVGNKKVLLALSGGVDSATLALLLQKAINERLICMFIDHGFMRANEPEEILESFSQLNIKVIYIDAKKRFMDKLVNISDPEQKRKIIGKEFIDTFNDEIKKLDASVEYLAQGTLYSDVIESSGIRINPKTGKRVAATIKSHHNVGGLPENMPFKLLEPIRTLFKDEVRELAKELGLPDHLRLRHPFPGPGLAIRVLGDITEEKIEIVRKSDLIVRQELKKADANSLVWQILTVLLPIKSVGVMGDERSYAHPIVLRAVTSNDAMTADWARLPYELLDSISRRIVNEVAGVNRVVYDITSKPPGTIEWE
jgi:GMP synthase (glutamine-hydrolysing)